MDPLYSSPQQSLPPSHDSSRAVPTKPLPCVCILGDIRNQVLSENEVVRFRCLAIDHGVRCLGDTKDFEHSHKILTRKAKEVLNSQSLTTAAVQFSLVIRMFFCEKHRHPEKFPHYFESIKLRWKGDGNDEEVELLNAIRQARLFNSVPVAETIRSPTSSATPPRRNNREGGHGTRYSASRILFQPTEQSRNTRSKNNSSERSSDTQWPLRLDDQPSQESNQSNTSFQGSSHFAHLASQSQATSPRPNTTTPTSEFSIRAPLRGSPSQGAQKGDEECQNNPPITNSIFGGSQDADTRSGRDSTVSSTTLEDSISDSSSPSPPLPVFNFFGSQSNVGPITWAETVTPQLVPPPSRPILNSNVEEPPRPVPGVPQSTADSAARIFRDRDVQRPLLNEQTKATTVPQVPRLGARATRLPTKGIHLQHTRLRPNNIPQRQGSKDDSFLAQTTSSVEDSNILDPVPLTSADIDVAIRKMIRDNVDSEGGVYIFRAPEYFKMCRPGKPALLKIGKSTNIKDRLEELKKNCGIFDISRVSDGETRSIAWYSRIEKLVHCELQNYRRIFRCLKCGKEHREWFEVSEEVALLSVQRWRKFMEQEPYDKNGVLKDHWSNMIVLGNMSHPEREEQWNDYQSRNERWGEWLERGIKEQEEIQQEKIRQEEIRYEDVRRALEALKLSNTPRGLRKQGYR